MFAVIFEVQPKKERWDDYLGKFSEASSSRVGKIEGFIDNERFGSKRKSGLVLSLSTWRDEKAVIRWRTLSAHHAVQERGRLEIFEDYHLRVGEITADTHVPEGQKLQEQRCDETEVGSAKAMTISELAAKDEKSASSDPARDLGLRLAFLTTRFLRALPTPGKCCS